LFLIISLKVSHFFCIYFCYKLNQEVYAYKIYVLPKIIKIDLILLALLKNFPCVRSLQRVPITTLCSSHHVARSTQSQSKFLNKIKKNLKIILDSIKNFLVFIILNKFFILILSLKTCFIN